MTPTLGRVPNQPKTPLHSFRVDDELWQAAKERPREARRITVTLTEKDGKDDALRKFLERYSR